MSYLFQYSFDGKDWQPVNRKYDEFRESVEAFCQRLKKDHPHCKIRAIQIDGNELQYGGKERTKIVWPKK